MRDDEDGGLDWDEYMAMSEAEVAALEARLLSEYRAMLDAMPPGQYYRYQRGKWLDIVRDKRRFLRNGDVARIEVIDEMFRAGIRTAQVMFLKLRAYRATGAWPGSG